MRKAKKSIITLSILGAAFAFSGAYALNNVSAKATGTQEIAVPTFYMDGASVRYSSEKAGLRFVAAIAASDYDEYEELTQDYTVTTGALIIPTTELSGKLTLENVTDEIMNVVIKTPVLDEEDGIYEFRGVVSAMPTNAYLTEMMGVGYMQLADKTTGAIVKTVYTETITRTVSYVSYCATQNTAWYNGLTEAEQATLTNFVADRTYKAITVDGVADVDYAYGYTGQTITISTPEAGDKTLAVSVKTESGATVTVTDNTFVMPAEAVTVTAKYQETLVGEQYALTAGNTLQTSGIVGLKGTVMGASVKNSSVECSVENGVVSIAAGLTAGTEYTLVLETADTVYETTLFAADTVLKSTTDVANWFKGSAKAGYTVVSDDFDMNGADLTSTMTWTEGQPGNLDGRGHIISNFTTSLLFGKSYTNEFNLKNIGLVFSQSSYSSYKGIIVAYEHKWSGASENVWMDITLTVDNTNRAIFAQDAYGVKYSNTVINVNLVGSGTGTVYADSLTAITSDSRNVTMTNVYVVGDVAKYNSNHGWEALNVVDSVADVNSIGGAFECKANGLYWNGKCVKTLPVELEEQYFLATQETKTVDTAELKGFTGTLVSASIKEDAALVCAIENGVVTLPALTTGTEYTLVLTTADAAYEATVLVADKLLTNVDEFTAYATAPDAATTYVALTTDLDMNGAALNSSLTWTSNFTLDGRGHIISNFTTTCLFMKSWGGGVLKNIGLEFTQNSTYIGLTNGEALSWFEMCNVWMNITVTKSASTRTVFGNQIKGLTANNVVINLNLVGTGAGTIYADYNTAPTGTSQASKLNNVYVVCSETLARKDTTATYGWDKLNVVTSVSGITSIGGNFGVKTDGLYYSGVKVL
ncbi:MAG: hypothetical protein IKA88_03600 [Clostridia bacterium]|nr:hypothetical protein [Clostridia bacterium]